MLNVMTPALIVQHLLLDQMCVVSYLLVSNYIILYMSIDYDGLISPPVNITVYVGQTAVFSSQTLPQCFLRAYFNDCKVQDDRCLFASFNESSYLNCTISNAQLSDDGTKIDMYIFSSFNSINCYDTVFLTVIGKSKISDNVYIHLIYRTSIFSR